MTPPTGTRIPVVDQINEIASKTAYMPMQAFLQWSQTLLLLAVVGGGFAVYRSHAAQLERIQNNTNETSIKLALAQQELSHSVNSNTVAMQRMEDKVVVHLLGLKKDADTIKKEIKEVKEQPKDLLGNRIPSRSVEVLPVPEVTPQ